MAEFHARRKLYGRRQTKPLSLKKRVLFETLLPVLCAPYTRIPSPLWLEIGFGNGEHLVSLMDQNPGVSFIGAEPFVNGMASFLYTIKDRPHDNIRLWMDDAMILAVQLPDSCVDRIYILNPDPWPKKRHHKRRLINRDNLDALARIIKPSGLLILATDVDDLAEWMITECVNHPDFQWTAERADDWRKAPEDWIETRYEQKGRKKGRTQTYLIFRRKEGERQDPKF